jgi:RNA polymerase sigma factor (sigma-70 family)
MEHAGDAVVDGAPRPRVTVTGMAEGADIAEEPDGKEAVVEFVAFCGGHHRPVSEALALTLGDTHLAAEAADEAMARAYQRWAKVQTYQNPEGWVYRVGLNWARSFLRRRQRAPQPFSQGFDELAPANEPSLTDALRTLDIKQRSVIVCRYYLALSEAETAAVLGIRPGTVKSRLHRGLGQLSTRLHHLRPEDLR